MSEADWAASLGGQPVQIMIQLPSDPSSPGLDGSIASVTVPIMASIMDMKTQLVAKLENIAANKFQLKSPSLGFLKDKLTAAHFNLKNGDRLEMVLKTRGGRR